LPVLADPFAGVRAPREPTTPWEKRLPYDEVAALAWAAADPHDHVLVLLGAHVGLRAGKCMALRGGRAPWSARPDGAARQGWRGTDGGDERDASVGTPGIAAPDGRLRAALPGVVSAWRHVQALCGAAGVAPKGVHSLVYVLWRVRYNVSMSIAPSVIYCIALCVCGWRVVHRLITRGRGERLPYDALLWLSGVVLVLLPIVAAISSASGWSNPETLYPTLFSVGWVVVLLAWDLRSVRSMARRSTKGVGEGA